MRQINIHKAKTQFSKLIREVQNGNEVVIAKGNKPVAKLVAIDTKQPKRKLGTAKGKFKMAPDFDSPVDDFTDYR